MNFRDILRFLMSELRIAIDNSEHERVAELGTAIEVLYEAAKSHGDTNSTTILDRMNYIVYHYRDVDSFADMNFDEISNNLADE